MLKYFGFSGDFYRSAKGLKHDVKEMFWMAQADEAKKYFSKAQEVLRIIKVGLFVRFYLKVLMGPFLYHRELLTKKQSNLKAGLIRLGHS